MTSKLKLILFYSKVVVIILCAKLNRCKKSRARAMHAWIENGAAWNHDIVRECSKSYHMFGGVLCFNLSSCTKSV